MFVLNYLMLVSSLSLSKYIPPSRIPPDPFVYCNARDGRTFMKSGFASFIICSFSLSAASLRVESFFRYS